MAKGTRKPKAWEVWNYDGAECLILRQDCCGDTWFLRSDTVYVNADASHISARRFAKSAEFMRRSSRTDVRRFLKFNAFDL